MSASISPMIIIGEKDCSISKLVSLLTISKSFGLLTQKWSDIARELDTPSSMINKLKSDHFLDKLNLSDVLFHIVEDWVGRNGREATLEKFNLALERHGLKVFVDLLKEEFLPAAMSSSRSFRKYCRISSELQVLLSQTKKGKSICILLSKDLSITLNKLQDNMENYVIHNFKDFLDLISASTFNETMVHFVQETGIKNLKKVIYEVLSINQKSNKCIRVVALTTVDNEEELRQYANSVQRTPFVHFSLDNVEWGDLTPAYSHQIKQKLEETLQLEFEEEELGKILYGKVLTALINGNGLKLFRNTIPKELSYYVNRTVVARDSISFAIFDLDSSDVLVFSGIQRYELSGFVKNQITDTSSNQIRLGRATVKYIILDHHSHFRRICELTVEPVHWLRYETRKFRWLRSRGDMTAVKNCVDDQITNHVKEEDLCGELRSNDSLPIVISDSPGMGKTILLSQIGNRLVKLEPDKCVLYLVLSELIKQVKHNEIQDKAEVFKKVLKKMVCENDWGEAVLESKLNSTAEVTIELLLDGFDEVDPRDLDLALEMLLAIKNSYKSIRLWITSRPHLLEELENNLNTLGYNIKPFTKEDQLRFLTAYWAKNKQLNQTKLMQYAVECIKIVKARMDSKDNDITGIPLQCLLIAEVYEEEAIVYENVGESLVPTIFINSITDLYKWLVVKKFEKYFITHVRSDFGGTEKLTDMHIRLSIELIFPEHFENLESKFPTVEIKELLKVGILEATSTPMAPRFLHRTFAEYFVALFVLDMVRSIDMVKPFLGSVLSCQDSFSNKTGIDSFKFTHTAITYFLNSLIPDFQSMPDQSIQNLRKLFDSEQLIQRIVHSCANADHSTLFNFFLGLRLFEKHSKFIFNSKFLLLAIEKSNVELVRPSLVSMVTHQNFDFNLKIQVLHHAIRMGEFSTVEFFMNERKLRRIVELSREKTRELLHHCIEGSKTNSERELEHKIQIIGMLVQINRELLEVKNVEGRTPLLSKGVHIRLILELVRLGADTLARDEFNDTVLHLRRGEKDNLTPEEYQTLLVNIPPDLARKLVGVKGRYGHTPLIRLLEEYDPISETLRRFADFVTDFNCVDDEGISLLEISIKHGRLGETLRKLIEYGADYVSWRGDNGRTLLHVAAEFGNSEAVGLFINEQRVDVNIEDNEGFTPLDYVVKSEFTFGKPFETGLALHERSGRLKKVINSKGQSWLHVSAHRGKLQSVQFLIHIGAYINVVDEQGNSPLHLLVTNWNTEKSSIIKLFLEHNANPVLMNSDGDTPFHLALKIGNVDFPTFELLKSASKINWTPTLANLALKIVVTKGLEMNRDKFNALVYEFQDKGADFSHMDTSGNSLLHMAAQLDHLKAVELLVKKVDVNLRNKQNSTALHVAASQRANTSFPVIKILVDNGGDVSAKNNEDNTFLHIYVSICNRSFRLHSISMYLADKNLAELYNIPGGSLNRTPLHLAVTNFEPEEKTLKLLYSSGVNFSSVDRNGWSALSSSVWGRRSTRFLNQLISYGADWRALTKHESSMLHIAAEGGTLESLKLLLGLGGLDVNGINGDGNTPLHCAVCQSGKSGVVEKCKMLIEKGANLNITNNQGFTPFQYAKVRKEDNLHEELSRVLNANKDSALTVTVGGTANENHASLDALKYLLENNKDLDKKEDDAASLLRKFIHPSNNPTASEFHAMCEYLVSQNVSNLLNSLGGKSQSSIFQDAMISLEVYDITLAQLHSEGSNFDQLDNAGNSILSYAIRGKRSTKFLSTLIHGYGVSQKVVNDKKQNLLHISSIEGSIATLSFFLEFGCLDVNEKDVDGCTPLHSMLQFSESDIHEKCQLLVNHGATLNCSNKRQQTPLHLAIFAKNKYVTLQLIKYLIDHGADASAKDVLNQTFLHCYLSDASELSSTQFHSLVEYICSKNNSKLFNTPGGKYGILPLQQAVYRLEPEQRTMFLLHQQGVNFNVADADGNSLLSYGIKGRRSVDFLSNLISNFGANPKHVNNANQSLLHITAQYGGADAMEFLLGFREVEIDSQDEEGDTPLHTVVTESKIQVFEKCRVLIAAGADINYQNNWLETSLHLVADRKDKAESLKVIKYLIENEGAVFAKNFFNDTFLHVYLLSRSVPANSQFHSLVKYLIGMNFSDVFNTPGGKLEYTALHLAVQYLELEESTLSLLRSRGANFNAMDINGNSILSYAIWGKRSSKFVLRLVSQFGAVVKQKNKLMDSLLHTAAYFGTFEVLKALLELGKLEINGKNAIGNTPLHLAVHPEREQIDGHGFIALTKPDIVYVAEKCKLLIRLGADINVVNSQGNTPLSILLDTYNGDNKDEVVKLFQSE